MFSEKMHRKAQVNNAKANIYFIYRWLVSGAFPNFVKKATNIINHALNAMLAYKIYQFNNKGYKDN